MESKCRQTIRGSGRLYNFVSQYFILLINLFQLNSVGLVIKSFIQVVFTNGFLLVLIPPVHCVVVFFINKINSMELCRFFKFIQVSKGQLRQLRVG